MPLPLQRAQRSRPQGLQDFRLLYFEHVELEFPTTVAMNPRPFISAVMVII